MRHVPHIANQGAKAQNESPMNLIFKFPLDSQECHFAIFPMSLSIIHEPFASLFPSSGLVMSEAFLRKTYIDNNSTAQLEEGLHVNKVTDYKCYSLISDWAWINDMSPVSSLHVIWINVVWCTVP